MPFFYNTCSMGGFGLISVWGIHASPPHPLPPSTFPLPFPSFIMHACMATLIKEYVRNILCIYTYEVEFSFTGNCHIQRAGTC